MSRSTWIRVKSSREPSGETEGRVCPLPGLASRGLSDSSRVSPSHNVVPLAGTGLPARTRRWLSGSQDAGAGRFHAAFSNIRRGAPLPAGKGKSHISAPESVYIERYKDFPSGENCRYTGVNGVCTKGPSL